MPFVTIKSNAVAKDAKQFLKELSALTAQAYGKPEAYVAVQLEHNEHMLFGGTDEPCALAVAGCIGEGLDDAGDALSKGLAGLLQRHLGVGPARYYVQLHQTSPAAVGWNGTLFSRLD